MKNRICSICGKYHPNMTYLKNGKACQNCVNIFVGNEEKELNNTKWHKNNIDKKMELISTINKKLFNVIQNVTTYCINLDCVK